MSLSPSVTEKPTLSSKKQIGDLADADLSEVFKRLPPYDRLIVSEVSRRWLELSRKAWVDVKHLDLTPIPGQHIASIIKQCPNLRSVFALGKSVDLNELACLSKSSQLSTVKFYDCTFAVKRNSDHPIDSCAKIFFENIQQASWNELVVHNARVNRAFAASCGYAPIFSVGFLPVSLTRLQVSGLLIVADFDYDKVRGVRVADFDHCADVYPFLNALDRLQNLECLILHSTPPPDAPEAISWAFSYCDHLWEKISALKNLKELCIGPAVWWIGRLIANLPKLEVLFLNEINYDRVARDLEDLITNSSVLRILVLSGSRYAPHHSDTIDLPARKRFPHRFGYGPLPLLHVFVGGAASEKLRFAKSSSDASIIHPINQPMPEFLDREDIAPIFEGVWVAEKIKEAARDGGRLWNYQLHDTARSVQYIEI